jgi:uncharacterized protein (DUF1697 family)
MLRGINVGGAKKIAMADLKALYESLGFRQVTTYVQSGNVVFDGESTDRTGAAARVEAGIREKFGFDLPVFMRQAADFQRIVDGNRFITEMNADPGRLHVTFLYRAPDPALLEGLKAPAGETDEFIPGQDEILLHCPNGYGRTKLSNQFFENRLNVPATTRNWNTVLALLRLASEGSR